MHWYAYINDQNYESSAGIYISVVFVCKSYKLYVSKIVQVAKHTNVFVHIIT